MKLHLTNPPCLTSFHRDWTAPSSWYQKSLWPSRSPPWLPDCKTDSTVNSPPHLNLHLLRVRSGDIARLHSSHSDQMVANGGERHAVQRSIGGEGEDLLQCVCIEHLRLRVLAGGGQHRSVVGENQRGDLAVVDAQHAIHFACCGIHHAQIAVRTTTWGEENGPYAATISLFREVQTRELMFVFTTQTPSITISGSLMFSTPHDKSYIYRRGYSSKRERDALHLYHQNFG